MQVKLRGVAVVVLEHTSQSFMALNLTTGKSDFITWFNGVVADALMIAFGVVVFSELSESSS